MQNENTKFIPRTQMQTILDQAPQGVDKKALIDKFVAEGYKVEGVNDQPEPNIAQKVAGGLINLPTNLVGSGLAGVGALGAYTGKKLAGQETTLAGEYANQTEQIQNSAVAPPKEFITGENIQPAQNLEQLAGQVVGTAGLLIPGATIPRAALSGAAIFGGEAMQDNASASEVVKQALLGGVLGGTLGAISPAINAISQYSKLATPVVKEGSKALKPTAASIMQRVARIPKGKQSEFADTYGTTVGKYLEDRGMIGTEEEVATRLGDWFLSSRNAADDGFAQLPGKFQPEPVKTALLQLNERLQGTSAKGAIDPDLAKVKELLGKFDSNGLNMTEINEAKRLFERRVKLGYNKLMNAKEVELATNVDSAIRDWQRVQADRLGFKNLGEINQETQMSKFLLDSLEREIAGKAGNNAVSLTDWVILAEGGPVNMAAFLAKKGLSSDWVQSKVAKMFANTPTKGIPTAKVGEADFDATVQSYFDFLKKTEGLGKQSRQPKPQTKSQISSDSSIPQTTKKASSKAIPKELQPLAEEAKKYKSAEEFVKAQHDKNIRKSAPDQPEVYYKAMVLEFAQKDSVYNKQLIDLYNKVNGKI